MTRKTPIAVLLTVLALSTVGLAAATPNPNATYYDNQTEAGSTSSWLAGLIDASLDDILSMALRVGTYVIGGGVTAQGGVGSAGALLTALLVSGVIAGIGMRAGAGTVGGSVIGVSAGFLFLTIGIGPSWAYPIVLFIVGLIASAVLIRLTR